MEMYALQVCSTLLVIALVAVVVWMTQWLVLSEQDYARASFPVTKSDRIRGLLLGLLVAVSWGLGDAVLHRSAEAPVWDAQRWPLRILMFVMFLTAGRLTFAEIFRARRCRHGTRSGQS